MKWEKPPLIPVTIPPLVGLLSAVIGFTLAPKLDIQEKLLSDIAPLILSWIILIFFSTVLMFTIPKKWGEPKEIRMGLMAGLILVFLPQACGIALLLCALWFLFVITSWVFVSTYQWRYEVQPFRIGVWLGVGGLTGMFIGAWAMGVILSA